MLKPEQQIAINYLSLPNHGGLTMQQIAQKCGVNRKTLYTWRNDPKFEAKLKRNIIRLTQKMLPEILQAMTQAVIVDRNAVAAKLIFQMHGLLPDSGESVDEKLSRLGNNQNTPSTDDIRGRIDEYKQSLEGLHITPQ